MPRVFCHECQALLGWTSHTENNDPIICLFCCAINDEIRQEFVSEGIYARVHATPPSEGSEDGPRIEVLDYTPEANRASNLFLDWRMAVNKLFRAAKLT